MNVFLRCAQTALPFVAFGLFLTLQTACSKSGRGTADVNAVEKASAGNAALKPLAANCTASGKKYVRDLFATPNGLDKKRGITFSSRVDWEKGAVLDCGGLVAVSGRDVVFADVELRSENYETYDFGKADFRKHNSMMHGLLEQDQFTIFGMNIGEGSEGALIERLPTLLSAYLEKAKAYNKRCEKPGVEGCNYGSASAGIQPAAELPCGGMERCDHGPAYGGAQPNVNPPLKEQEKPSASDNQGSDGLW